MPTVALEEARARLPGLICRLWYGSVQFSDTRNEAKMAQVDEKLKAKGERHGTHDPAR